jgi:inhibitor of Bruton tyrosine kinase
MTLLHTHYALRNKQAFQRLLDGSSPNDRGGHSGASGVGLSSSGGKSWGRGSTLTTTGINSCDINARDSLGRTVLHLACSSVDPVGIEYVKMLLDHPAIDVNIQDTESQWTALHRALYQGNIAAA